MRPTRRALGPLVLAAASAALVACHRSNSVLLVEVAGDLTLRPVALQVVVTVGTQTRTLEVPPAPGPAITLPASFSVELDPGLTGPVVVSVGATDASGTAIAYGTTTQENLDVGGQTIITVNLGTESNGGGSPDAGRDVAPDLGGAFDATEAQ